MKVRSGLEGLYERLLGWQIRHVPLHIAIIQDGNRRFAKSLGLEAGEGHRAGADTTDRVLDWAHEMGVKYITLYSFSTENFRRDSVEVESLFSLFKERFERILSDDRIHRHRIRIRVFGDRTLLPPDLLERVEAAEAATRAYGNYFVNIALAYGGRNENRPCRPFHPPGGEGRGDHPGRESMQPSWSATSTTGSTSPPWTSSSGPGTSAAPPTSSPGSRTARRARSTSAPPTGRIFRKIDFFRALRLYDQRMRGREMPARV